MGAVYLAVNQRNKTSDPIEKRGFNAVWKTVGRGVNPMAVIDHLEVHKHVFIFVRGPDMAYANIVEEKQVA